MTRQAPRRDQDGIEAHIADALIGIARKPGLGGRNDALPLPRGDRPFGIRELLTCLDLNKDQKPPATGDQIDLAGRAFPATRQNAEALGHEQGCCPAFARGAGAKGELAAPIRLPRGCGRISRQAGVPC